MPLAISAAAFAVVGISKTTLDGPARSSETTVDVALADNVFVPVLFSFPSRILFTT